MNKNERTENTVRILINLMIIGVVTVFFYVIWIKYFRNSIFFFRLGNYMLAAVYAVTLTVFNSMYGGFSVGAAKTGDILFSQLIALFFTNLVIYMIGTFVNRMLPAVLPFFLSFLGQFAIVTVLVILGGMLFRRIFPAKKTILVYDREDRSVYERLIRNQSARYDVQRSETFSEFVQSPEQMKEYECILAVGLTPQDKDALIRMCYDATKSVYLIPDVYDVIVNSARSVYLLDTPVMKAAGFGPGQLSKIVKRLFDIFFALVLLVIASPICLVTAIAIKLTDGGPVLYKQTRLTQYGRPFEIYKFRSMRVDAEKDGKARLASQNDDRITGVGKFIRSCRIDELPQLINILKGDMSVVGPRPERPELVEEILKEVPEFNYRLKVKAGLTGYAQVYGKYNTRLRDKLLFDLYYIENFSLFLDVRIMFMTFKILFMKESTEGVEDPGK
ncbi:MAG: sugar transferase [Solobacterium sp.]|nr:sugar transferase [Solobacterium sp.]